ncbi:MAG: M24 family metallopeptidase [bacterium]|nr:M24 family metallopeptidase [bacterium]
MDYYKIQEALKEQNLDGWLLYSFQGINPIAERLLNISEGSVVTRRLFYFIPASGEPLKLVSKIEDNVLDELPGKRIRYLSYKSLKEGLKEITKDAGIIAMEYTPDNSIPYISRVDAGTIELLRSLGKEIVSSADLIQLFEATLTDEQIDSHYIASKLIRQFISNAFDEICTRIKKTGKVREHHIQHFLTRRFEEHNLISSQLPIVAANENAANPHYEPVEGEDSNIREDSLVLIDLCAKQNKRNAVYAEITHMAYPGSRIPSKYADSFSVVVNARDAAVELLKNRFEQNIPVYGWEVDNICRNILNDAGYGNCFIHRTGHSIGEEIHGYGANMDNLETRDERQIIPRTIFSIEPGIYSNTYGVRSEINILITEQGEVEITSGEPQMEIELISL